MKTTTTVNLLSIFFFIIFSGCEEDSKQVEPEDFRSKYLGTFIFDVIVETHHADFQTEYDTVVYEGEIRFYHKSDSYENFSSWHPEPTDEPEDDRITIQFLNFASITPSIDSVGKLTMRLGDSYSHQGSFSGTDYVDFSVRGIGGRGQWKNYFITGTRKQ
jgi:hypothetical protein